MNRIFYKRTIIIFLLIMLISSCCIPAFEIQNIKLKTMNLGNLQYNQDIKYLEIELSFSDPEIEKYGNYWIVKVKETNHNRYVLFDLDPGKPVLPVNISFFNLEFNLLILFFIAERTKLFSLIFSPRYLPLIVTLTGCNL